MTQGPDAQPDSIDDLEQDLNRVRAELDEYQELIEELPSIYEGKFRHQLQTVAQDIRRLLDEQQALQEQIHHALAPSGPQPEALPASPATPIGLPRQAQDPLETAQGGLALVARIRRGLQRSGGPDSSSPSRLVLLAMATALVAAALAASVGVMRRARSPQPASPAEPSLAEQARPPGSQADSPAEEATALRLRFNGECWIEAQTLDGETILATTFQQGDVRSLPLGQGLRLLAGRPDLVQVAVGDDEFRTLGTIDRIDWVVISPPTSP